MSESSWPDDVTMSPEPAASDSLSPSSTLAANSLEDMSMIPQFVPPRDWVSPSPTHSPISQYSQDDVNMFFERVPVPEAGSYEFALTAMRQEVLEHTRAYLTPIYSPDGESYAVLPSSRVSSELRRIMNAYFAFEGGGATIFSGDTRAEGFRRYAAYRNGEYPGYASPVFDVDARDALGFELWRDGQLDHAIPVHGEIYGFILESRSNLEATFSPSRVKLAWLKLDNHRSQAVEFEDLLYRQHLQLLFVSAFIRPFVEPDQ